MSRGFTLIEMITVVVVIGILVAIAIPQYTTTMERSRAAEGVSILGTIRGAQLRYYAEHGAYAPQCTFTTPNVDNCGLDIDIGPLRYFQRPMTWPNPTQLGTIGRNADSPIGQYSLWIQEDGTITCNGAVGACAKLGY
jgi:prepilin-type N-terminal cleavage/methylation domain-containing protein